jgi:sugar lactone lactonase YvrE
MHLKSARIARAFVFLIAAACDYSPPTGGYQQTVDPPVGVFPDGLWTVSGIPGEILGFDGSQLLATGAQTPATKLFTSSASLIRLNSVAFDDNGTMWVASEDDSLLLAFTPESNGVPGFTTPKIVIGSSGNSIAGPTGIAFDNARGLWVASFASGKLVHYTASQLTKSGSPVPSVVITGITHPTSLAFDGTGALWVTDLFANTVSRYLVGQLFTSGEKEPVIVLTSNGTSIAHPTGIAFDASNNMWISNAVEQSVVAFRPPQRASTGSPTPFVTLKPTETTLAGPGGPAFDQTGNLWVVGASGTLSKFSLQTIAASGPAEPDVQIRISDHALTWSAAFWPKPVGFPLN